MNNWRERYQIAEKWTFNPHGNRSGTYYLVIDKLNPGFSVNMTQYWERQWACSAASNMFRAEQRRIEKALLG